MARGHLTRSPSGHLTRQAGSVTWLGVWSDVHPRRWPGRLPRLGSGARPVAQDARLVSRSGGGCPAGTGPDDRPGSRQ